MNDCHRIEIHFPASTDEAELVHDYLYLMCSQYVWPDKLQFELSMTPCMPEA